MQDKQYYIRINGSPIPVSEQVYRAYWHYTRKETYFTYDLKSERFIYDPVQQKTTFIPSREDSLERLMETDNHFSPQCEELPEDMVIKKILLEQLQRALQTLTADEQNLIQEFFFQNRTVQEISNSLKIAPSTLRDRKQAILKKLKDYVETFSS